MEACDQVVQLCVRKCPFLAELADRHGEEFARSMVVCPGREGVRRPLLEEDLEVQHTFALFHGPSGVLPLARAPEAGHGGCPFSRSAALGAPGSRGAESGTPSRHVPPPLAAMSLSFGGGDFGDFLFKKLKDQRRSSSKQGPGGSSSSSARANNLHGPASGAPTTGSGPASSNTPGKGGPSLRPRGTGSNGNGPQKPVRGPKPPSAADLGLTNGSAPPAGPSGLLSPSGSGAASLGGSGTAAAGGCPLRRWLGPFAGLVFNQYDKLVCPPAIVAARAALARTAPVRALRPQALEVKLLAVAATAAALNVPCGVWREHTEKFSPEWFLAVHATIPFVAMLRKAVIMPKLAILVTIGAAVAGQVVGSRLERQRLQLLAAEGGADSCGSSSSSSGMRSLVLTAATAAAAASLVLGESGAGEDSNCPARAAKSGPLGLGKGLVGGQKLREQQQQLVQAGSCRGAAAGAAGGQQGFLGLGGILQELPVVRC